MITESKKSIKIKDKPAVRKVSGLKKDGTLNASWVKFHTRIDGWVNNPTDVWDFYDVLGYIINKYKDCFGFDYSFTYSGSPSKSPEIYTVKRMMNTLCGPRHDFLIAREYIDWVFSNIVMDGKREVMSLALFFSTKVINKFKFESRKAKVITRDKELPKKYLDVILSMGIDGVSTYGDICFVKKACENRDDEDEYVILLKRLEDAGFDVDLVDFLD